MGLATATVVRSLVAFTTAIEGRPLDPYSGKMAFAVAVAAAVVAFSVGTGGAVTGATANDAATANGLGSISQGIRQGVLPVVFITLADTRVATGDRVDPRSTVKGSRKEVAAQGSQEVASNRVCLWVGLAPHRLRATS